MIKTLLIITAMLIDPPLEDPRQEARAQALMREIRCVACENEPISQSAAPIAEDMRARVREMISQGASDREVRAWFVDRYDEFVLFRPPARQFSDWLLWLGPFAILLGGGAWLVSEQRRNNSPKKITPVAAEATDHADGKSD